MCLDCGIKLREAKEILRNKHWKFFGFDGDDKIVFLSTDEKYFLEIEAVDAEPEYAEIYYTIHKAKRCPVCHRLDYECWINKFGKCALCIRGEE